MLQSADCSADYKLSLYIPVCHTNRRSIKKKIGVVVDRLVAMGLKSTRRLGACTLETDSDDESNNESNKDWLVFTGTYPPTQTDNDTDTDQSLPDFLRLHCKKFMYICSQACLTRGNYSLSHFCLANLTSCTEIAEKGRG